MKNKQELINRVVDFYLTGHNLKENEAKAVISLIDEYKAINYTHCCEELKSDISPNFKFRNEDFKYSEFIKGVGKEYNYILGNKHYFVDGELVKIL
tara:strand:+ start:3925 stop:4212 length:288 start_codon:yes stop_codon:yes gene_type:complete